MNILIKLTCLVGLVIAPILGKMYVGEVDGTKKAQFDQTKQVIADANQNAQIVDLTQLQGNWFIDTSHAFVDFSVRHLLTSAKGAFSELSGTYTSTGDLATTKITVNIPVTTISTGNKDRDGHLSNEDFFDVTKFPVITYVSDKVEKTDKGYTAKGKLTMKGVTKDLDLPFTYFGKMTTQWGTEVAAFEGEVKVNRFDYGVSGGKGSVGEEVTIHFSVELNPVAPQP